MNQKLSKSSDSNDAVQTGFQVPLWIVGSGAGIAGILLLSLFFFGSYSGLGSSL